MTEKKKFPKPTGRIGKGLAETLKPVIEDANTVSEAEVVSEEAPKPKAPVVDRWIKITVDAEKKSHIDINGFNGFEALVVLKGAHKYLFEQVQKELEKLNGAEEGTANPVSGGNS